jgi:hypothetical protein
MAVLRGKYVRVEVYREGNLVELCISPVHDASCEDSVRLYMLVDGAREKVEELVSEIASLMRRALNELW